MNSNFVPVEEHLLFGDTLEAACLLGRQVSTYIEGIPVAPTVSALLYLSADVAIGSIALQSPDFREDRAVTSRRRFEGFMAPRGTSPVPSPNSGLSCG